MPQHLRRSFTWAKQLVRDNAMLSRTAPGTQARRREFRALLERLEERVVLDAEISGTVFQQLDASGLFPATVGPGTNLSTIPNVTVSLDGGAMVTTTNATGAYQFLNVSPNVTHSVSVQLPPGYLGFNAQSLSYNLTLTPNEQFPNLNFALTPKDQALVQNLYELVLSRPADLNGFQTELKLLTSGGPVGQVFTDLYTSPEFKAESQPIASILESFFPATFDIGAFRNSVQLQNLGVSEDATVLQILYSQQFVSKFGDLSKLSNASYVTFMYKNLLNRAPNKQELHTWVNMLKGTKTAPPTANRGDVPISLVNSAAFSARKPGVSRRTAVSLAFLGELGRLPTSNELGFWTAKLRRISTVALGNAIAATPEFKNLNGFTDTFVWDVDAQQIAPAIDPLSRLAMYDPATGQFDEPVTAGSIQSTAAQPKNVYFLVHGWAPGLTQDVLLGSTPGDPLKWWQTDDSPWLLNGVTPISTQGLAQSIVAGDPNAVVIAFSWIDQSATPAGSNTTVSGKLTAKKAVVQNTNTSGLAVGMNVSGQGIPAGAYIAAINNPRRLTLSVKSNSTVSGELSINNSEFTLPAQATAASAIVQNVNTTRLVPGMTVAGSGNQIKSGTTIASIDSPTQLTLSTSATASTSLLTFTGTNLTFGRQTGTLLPNSGNTYTVIAGINTSTLTAGMTVVGGSIPANDTIARILTPTSISLTTAAPAGGSALLTFKGTNAATTLKQNLYASESEASTQQNGLVLADAIRAALAPNFFTTTSGGTGSGLIHIMGHSHGSKVATVAALALQQANVPVAQLTTLESPEAGPSVNTSDFGTINANLAGFGGAENFNWYYLDQMNISHTPVGPNRTSTNSTFVDNYFANSGLGSAYTGFNLTNFPIPNSKNSLSNIVDVEFQPAPLVGSFNIASPLGAVATVFGSHDYPPPWYAQSASLPASSPPVGLNWSPLINPANTPPPANSFYQQTTSFTQTLNVTQNVAEVQGVNTTNLLVGMTVTDSASPTAIAPGTTIASINAAANEITLSPAPSITASGDTLTFQYNEQQFLARQFNLTPTSNPVTFSLAAPVPLEYAEQYAAGTVGNTGSSITLAVGPNQSQSLETITYNPLAANIFALNLGAGMTFQVAFSGVSPGQDVQLTVWMQGMATTPTLAGSILGPTLGYLSMPVFTMDSDSAGTTPQNATISLGGLVGGFYVGGPFNGTNSSSPATNVPILGFTLTGDVTSTVSVTVSAMNQFFVGFGASAGG
jgi:Domain of unknown function (DUF4214)